MNNTDPKFNASFCDNDDEQTTVNVLFNYESHGQVCLSVQTTDSFFRSSLGCMTFCHSITTWEEIELDGDTLKKAIDFAECFIKSSIEEIRTGHSIDNEDVYLIVKPNGVDVVVLNSQYFNVDTSPYQRKFSDVLETFETVEEAIQDLNSNY